MSLVEWMEVGAIDLSVNHIGYYTISTKFIIIHRFIVTGLRRCDGWLLDSKVRLMICMEIAYKKPKVVRGKNGCQGIASNLKSLMHPCQDSRYNFELEKQQLQKNTSLDSISSSTRYDEGLVLGSCYCNRPTKTLHLPPLPTPLPSRYQSSSRG